jgi:tetratricopeptide (TPR) repeat protein
MIIRSVVQLLAVSMLLLSCGNNKANEPVTTLLNTMPAKEKELRDVIEKYPDSTLLKKTLIQYFEDNGNFDVALAELNKLCEKDSTDASLWDKKAQLYLLKDDTTKAIPAYEKAIDILPDPEYIMALGWLYAQTKNPNALALADGLLLADKAKAAKEALLIKGLYFSNTGNKAKALAAFNECLALDYTFMLAYREKAIILYDEAKYAEAAKILERATTLQNNFDDGYFWLGKCYEKLGDNKSAIENYQTAKMYNANNYDAIEALAKLGVK